WVGMLVPIGVPKDLVARYSAEARKALAEPEVRGKLAAQGFEVVGSSPDEFLAFVRAGPERWAKVIRAYTIRVESAEGQIMKWIPEGVIPAVLLPFKEELSIDEPSFRAHLRDVASAEGLSAITINAHSTEVASCTFEEQKRVLAIAKDE